MSQRLFLIHFRGAIGAKSFFIVALYGILVLVRGVLTSRGMTRINIDGVITPSLFWLCAVSGYLDGATAFSRTFREKTSQFLSTLPIARTRAWGLILGAELLSLLLPWAAVLIVHTATLPERAVWPQQRTLAVAAVLLFTLLLGAASSCFSLIFRAPLWNVATGYLSISLWFGLYYLNLAYFFGGWRGFASYAEDYGINLNEAMVAPAAAFLVFTVIGIALSASWFRHGELDLGRTGGRHALTMVAIVLLAGLVVLPALLFLDRARRPWVARNWDAVDLAGGICLVISEVRPPYDMSARVRMVDLRSNSSHVVAEGFGTLVTTQPFGDAIVATKPFSFPLIRLAVVESMRGWDEDIPLPTRVQRLTADGTVKWTANIDGLTDVRFAENGSVLATVSGGGIARVLRIVPDGGVREIAKRPGYRVGVYWSVDGFLAHFYDVSLGPAVFRLTSSGSRELRMHSSGSVPNDYGATVFEDQAYADDVALRKAIERSRGPLPAGGDGQVFYRASTGDVYFVVEDDGLGELYAWTSAGWTLLDDRVLLGANEGRSPPGVSTTFVHVRPWLPGRIAFASVAGDKVRIDDHDVTTGRRTTLATLPREPNRKAPYFSSRQWWPGQGSDAGWISIYSHDFDINARGPRPSQVFLFDSRAGVFVRAFEPRLPLLCRPAADGRQFYVDQGPRVLIYSAEGKKREVNLYPHR